MENEDEEEDEEGGEDDEETTLPEVADKDLVDGDMEMMD